MEMEMETKNLTEYDLIVVNTSSGKDSQTMLHRVCSIAQEQGVLSRVHAVHADLGRAEWQGTRDLAQEQADHYKVPLHVIQRPQGDLVDHIRDRGRWPSSKARYCTSDHKRDQVSKVIRRLADALGIQGRKVRVLNCIGLRAEESPARSKKNPFQKDTRLSNSKRDVWTWLPIFNLSTEDVWADIRSSGVRHHWAYDAGMPRLSCVFCVFAPARALKIAAKHNPELFRTYCELEDEMGHLFRQGFSIKSVLADVPEDDNTTIEPWCM